MNKLSACFFLSVLLLTGCTGQSQERDSLTPLVRFDKTFDAGALSLQSAEAVVTNEGALQIRSKKTDSSDASNRPSVIVKPRDGRWNLPDRQYILFNIKNTGARQVSLNCWLTTPTNAYRMHLSPMEEAPCYLRIYPTRWKFDRPVKLNGFLQAAPGDPPLVDPANITGVGVSIQNASESQQIEIGAIKTGGTITPLKAAGFFPFIDEYGQYIHENWPGKIQSIKDFEFHREKEERELAADPGPPDRNSYGGWTKGPRLKATGFFRTEKHDGKWWLIDPEGYLFWSIGLCLARSVNEGPDALVNRNVTPITDREHYFRNLPSAGSEFSEFYGTGHWAPRGYYKGRTPYRTYDFTKANLLRKYGQGWPEVYKDVVHRRFKSWGLNTLAHRSDKQIILDRKTPYVASVEFEDVKFIEGSEAFWTKFYDVFDPSFRQALQGRLEAERGVSVNDPWCIGYFVNHEVAWGDDEVALAMATLRSPASQPAKKEFIKDLKLKYKSIGRLNVSWSSDFRSWEQLINTERTPDKRRAYPDLLAFSGKIAETYFSTVRDELKAAAPNQLYLGCRFANRNALVTAIAAQYADVVSFSVYNYSAEYLRLPNDIDKPILVGEFHFGALDRGLFYPSYRTMAIDQNDRAAKFAGFVESSLRNPLIVGAHWFQYRDEPTTGRADGENYQCGFVDTCDTPYPETVQACRLLSRRLYQYRLR